VFNIGIKLAGTWCKHEVNMSGNPVDGLKHEALHVQINQQCCESGCSSVSHGACIFLPQSIRLKNSCGSRMPAIRYLSNSRDLKLESDSCPGRLPQFEVAESSYFACAYKKYFGGRTKKDNDGSPASKKTVSY